MHDVSASPLVLIGGSVRAAAADAVAAGYCIVAIDRFGDRDLRAISNRWYPLDDDWERHLAAWPGAPIVATGGFPWHDAERLRRDRLVAFPTPAVFQSLCDPQQLRRVAAVCGIGFTFTISRYRSSGSSRVEPQPSPLERWLIKPRFGTGGIGIRWWSPGSAADDPDADGDPEDLQQWVAGRPLGVCYFARRRRGQRLTRLLGAFDGLTHRKHRDWRWLYGGSLGPRRLPTACGEQLSRLGAEVASTFGLLGLFNIDLIRRRDGSLVLLEINPRYSASMELLRIPSTNEKPGDAASLIDWHLAAYEEQAGRIDYEIADRRTEWATMPAVPSDIDLRTQSVSNGHADHGSLAQSESACKRIVYAAAPMQVDCSDEVLSRRFGAPTEKALGVTVSFHDLPQLGAIVPAGDPALSVIVRGPQNAGTLLRAAHQIAAQLRRSLRAP